MTGAAPVTGALIPILLTFTDPGDPGSAHAVAPDDLEKTLGRGFRLREVSVEAVPNGFWPLDFGGSLGEPVTRGIEVRLPWLNRAGNPAATALRAVELPGSEAVDARQAFERK
jgi:hypothetical protein